MPSVSNFEIIFDQAHHFASSQGTCRWWQEIDFSQRAGDSPCGFQTFAEADQGAGYQLDRFISSFLVVNHQGGIAGGNHKQFFRFDVPHAPFRHLPNADFYTGKSL